MAVRRHGAPTALARSRKLRALLAILVIEGRPVNRRRLCDLSWDRPNDPRAELRWHLSKLRQIVDDPDRLRILSGEDEIGIDLDGCVVDALQVLVIEEGDPPSLERLKALSELFRGQFLGELDLSGRHAEIWLAAQRRRFAACKIGILKGLVAAVPQDSCDIELYLERWLDLAPFDIEAHRYLLDHLIRRGRVAEAEAHVAAAKRFFVEEGVPPAGLQDAGRQSGRGPLPLCRQPPLSRSHGLRCSGRTPGRSRCRRPVRAAPRSLCCRSGSLGEIRRRRASPAA